MASSQEMVKKWRGDKTIALIEVVDGWVIFTTSQGGMCMNMFPFSLTLSSRTSRSRQRFRLGERVWNAQGRRGHQADS